MPDIFRGLGVPVVLEDSESFLKIVETLERIGIASATSNTLYQSCHILHKQGHYAIMHFKEMFSLDGKNCDFTKEDEQRRNRIACLLQEWNLLKIVDSSRMSPHNNIFIKVLRHSERCQWSLQTKYSIGNNKGVIVNAKTN